jgi:hypothetical protein
MNRILPFQRGSTLFAEVTTPVDDAAKEIIGQTFEVPDVLHGGGGRVTLRAVQNAKGSAITPALKFYSFQSATKDEWGAKIDGVATGDGELGKPLDDYNRISGLSSIVDNDVCFVVEEGLCRVLKTSTSFTAGMAIQAGASGKAYRAAAGDVVVGTAVTTAGASATNMIIRVTRGLSVVSHHA